MRIRYHCHYGKNTGYGRAAHDYLAALAAHTDAELAIVPLGEPDLDREARYRCLDEFVTAVDAQAACDVAIYHAPPHVLAKLSAGIDRSIKNVAVTTWETRPLPTALLGRLLQFDAIIVPSRHCEAVMRARVGVALRVPHCFDPYDWDSRYLRGRPAGEHTGRFRFYWIGAWCERKNPEGVLRAYLHEFSSKDECDLVMVSNDCDEAAVRSLVARSGLRGEDVPSIRIATHRLSEDELYDLHRGGDCYVSATRAEGWDLGMFEAVIMGNPVIAPVESGGQRDYLWTYPHVFPVDSWWTPCFGSERRGEITQKDGRYLQRSTVQIPPYVTARQSWHEPSLIALAEHMREIYGNRQREIPPFAETRQKLEDEYGYEPVAKQFLSTLEGILS